VKIQHGPRRLSAPAIASQSSIPIVAIGASAGGLDAVRAVLDKLPPDSGMAFVVIQHVDSAQPNALASLVYQTSSLPVLEISNRIAVQPNHVYLVPPNKRASICNGTFSLGRVKSQDRDPIDDLMAALGKAQGDEAMGVLLTEQTKLQDLAAANARDIRALSARLITSQEQERRRLARDIHDSLCQHLGILAAEIQAVAASFPASNPTGERLQAARKHALSIADEARQVARQLHPSILEGLGLPKALQNLCNEFRKREGISVHFRVLNKYRPVPIEVASCAYRIAQEAFNNIARHARAKKVTVLLSVRRGLHLSIRDDGAGFDPGAVQGSGGLGLVSMRERARLANGELSVEAQPGHGTRIKLALHLPGSAS
jgi:signal transduction histidine kinase